MAYYFLRTLVFFIGLFPLGAWTWLARLLAWVLGKVYRRKIVFANIKNAFLEKNNTELNDIVRSHYRYFAQLIVEGAWGLSRNAEVILARYELENIHLLDELAQKHGGAIAMMGHYYNWEWTALCAGHIFKDKGVAFYQPISNQKINDWLRKRFEGHLYRPKDTAAAFEAHHNLGCTFMMVSDQIPSSDRSPVWVEFLNQRTACLNGAAKYGHQYNYPLVYTHIVRTGLGRYKVVLEVLSENPQTETVEVLVERFMKRLERSIYEHPEAWLWSHRRWKALRKSGTV